MGGLPSWLLRDPSMRVRSSHEGFLAAARNYLQWLLPLVVPLQQSLGGPIIAVQVCSEPRRERVVVLYERRQEKHACAYFLSACLRAQSCRRG